MSGGSQEARKARWGRLERLLERLESKGPGRMAQDDLDEFVHLYRTACGDLARLRSDSPGHNLETWLNRIVARSHKMFRPREKGSLSSLLRFFTVDFPTEVRALGNALTVAALLFAVPLLLAAFYVYAYPQSAYSLASPEQLDMLADAYSKGHAGGRSEDMDALMAGFYINNNVGIAFQCFATGIFFALGSVLALLFNGVIIGAISGFICASGYASNFLSFVAGHGSFELTAIVLCGATGIRIGMLLVNPGPYTRLDAFKVHGKSILKVVLGSAAMLTVAAFIEAFWSPSSAPAVVKYVVALVLWTLVIAWL
ncbi:MAG: stage II sporulation protein M, partial [Deltaproteobacteria bacterium]|nr:stage II sporulation protein M [Deltaproteobacteria bacterium]